jgi:DNA-binding MarR family transcriptional regulator
MSESESENKIEFTISIVTNLWRRLYNRNARQFELSVSERRVLVAVDLMPNVSQSTIALYLDMEPQNLLRVIDRLEAGDYLERRSTPDDRRVKTLHLLAAGKKIIKDIYKFGNKFREVAFRDIPTDKLKQMELTLKNIEENLLTANF